MDAEEDKWEVEESGGGGKQFIWGFEVEQSGAVCQMAVAPVDDRIKEGPVSDLKSSDVFQLAPLVGGKSRT